MNGENRKNFFQNFFSKNVVLVQAVGLCPIIAGGTTLKNAVVMSLCALLTLLPTTVLMSYIGNKLPRHAQPPVYAIVASLLLFGFSYLLNTYISTELYASLYLFLPLLIINSLLTYHSNNRVSNMKEDVIRSLAASLGFSVVVCIMGTIREIAAFNTVWGITLPIQNDLPEAALPFSAFIILGFMAGILQWVTNKKRQKGKGDSK